MTRTIVFTSIAAALTVIALAFLIIGVVTAPVTTSLQLAQTSDYNYGIFGYCETGGSCLKALYPVDFSQADDKASWFLAAGTRTTLAKAFILSPIACGLIFLELVITVVSIPVQLSILKVLSLGLGVVAFLALAITAVFVVLVFHPHVTWAGWLLVAAAALLLVALPCLFLSITVRDDTATDEDDNSNAFGAYGQVDNDVSFTSSTLMKQNSDSKNHFSGPTTRAYANETSSGFSNEYGYRGLGHGYDAKKNGSESSLYYSAPNNATDLTRSDPSPPAPSHLTGSSTSLYGNTKLNTSEVPSTPVSSKQQMAPTLIPTAAIPANAGYPVNRNLPYPKSERGSVGLNSAQYGVFDHHPEVEGHQPFTELDDNDAGEQVSEKYGPADSDDDSDFTSVSQRQPNVDYARYNQAPPQRPQQYAAPVNFQQQQQQQPLQLPLDSSFYGSEGGNPQSGYNQSYGQGYIQGYHQPAMQQRAPPPPPQHQQYYQQPMSQGFQGANPQFQARQPQGPTISDSVLNNNPDFAVGGASRRKFVPVAARYGNNNAASRRLAGQGPYGAM